MKCLAHRGFWQQIHEKNSISALSKAFESGFGVETDVRDCLGELVICHDTPTAYEPAFEELIKLSLKSEPGHMLALNIKADGLAQKIHSTVNKFNLSNYFLFDMSIPDMRSYIRLKLPVFTRISEVEKDPIWIDQSEGIWLDAFESEWYSYELIENLLKAGKRVCIVSPELHGRKHQELWYKLKPIADNDNLLICTDFPSDAKSFFSS